MEPIVQLNKAGKVINKRIIIENIQLSILSNQTIAIVGHNGSGKSSLLRIIAGLSSLSMGDRYVKPGVKIGYVPERFPKLRMSAIDYLLHMGKIQGIHSRALLEKVQELILQFGLHEVKNRHMLHFSKGMLQKVAIIQAIMHSPRLLIMDEPLSGLDFDFQAEIADILLHIKNTRDTSIVFSCHEDQLLDRIADHVVVMENGRMTQSYPYSTDSGVYVTIKYQSNGPEEDDIEVRKKGAKIEKNASGGTIVCRLEHTDEILLTLLNRNRSIISVNRSAFVSSQEREV